MTNLFGLKTSGEIEQMFSGIDIRSRIVDEAERRGRVEELKELHNKMCFKHFDSKSMNPEKYSAVKEYVEKRLLKLQGVEK